MLANLSFGDPLELTVKALLELDRGNQVTDGACTHYRCAVDNIPAWVGIHSVRKLLKLANASSCLKSLSLALLGLLT